MRIVHAADIHLGRRRLDGRLPETDLAEAFAHIAREAVAARADVFLLAGDLFDRAQVEPPHLRQAQRVLAELKSARIPVVAVEGNHDKAFLHSEAPTWLQYLAEDDLLILLRTPFDSGGPILRRWEDARAGGAWIDLNGVRFVGAGYLGAATPHKVRQIAARLEPGRPHVLLLHAGPEYFVGEAGGFSADDLRNLEEKVCYLALGHIHKPMQHGGWACNPGSPENCDLREASYDAERNGSFTPRGYAVVELDPERSKHPRSIEVRNTPRRPCHRLTLDCTLLGDRALIDVPALADAAIEWIRRHKLPAEAVVELHLAGQLDLNRITLDPAALAETIERAAGVFAVALDLAELNTADLTRNPAGTVDGLARQDIELNAIRNLVDGKDLWGLEGRESEFATLFYGLKESVRAGRSSEMLAEQISQSHLVPEIQRSRLA